MKRLFSKRSGFTLVEIIIAFAIFAIMSSMILQMLNLAINQRRSNKDFEDELARQEELLAQGGKNTTYDSGKAGADDKISLTFKDKDGNDAVDFDMNYQMKPADSSNPNAADGINYFVGDFNYGADGSGSSGGTGTVGASGGATQASRYDTRITGIKGLTNITIKPEKLATPPALVSGTPDGYTWYKFTVSADSVKMMSEDKQIAQFRIYFYSKEFDSVKQEDSKGKITYKKVYKSAPIAALFYDSIEAKSDLYQIESSSNSVRFSITKTNNKKLAVQETIKHEYWTEVKTTEYPMGFDPSDDIVFYCMFKGDPQLDSASFGANGVDGVYNASPVYDETDGHDTGKTHVNIYGSFPYAVGSSPF